MTAFALAPMSARRLPRDTAAMALMGAAALVVLAGTAGSTPRLPERATEASADAPVPPPMAYRAVDPAQAQVINAAIPLSSDAIAAARPFAFGGASSASRANALDCLTSAIYYEAGQEPTDGQRAVAQVVLNRVRHPAFPGSVCAVVYQGSTRSTGCQFTFTCDGSLARAPSRDGWARARKVAEAALNGSVYAGVGNATHYHADYVLPYWAPTLAKTAVVGAHIFYRWAGGWGQPAAFVQAYAGLEPSATALRTAALAVDHTPSPASPLAAMPIAKVAGVAVRETDDGKRVRVHFTPQAREAVEKVAVKPYVERVEASDNLRYALGDAGASSGPALGSKAGTADTQLKAN